MSSRQYAVTEPHPSVPRSGGYIGGGRGGAGNFKRYKAEDLTAGPFATGPASRISLTRPFKRSVTAGRGGAGNFVTTTEEGVFQFDEEMIKAREVTAHATPVYRIGRGGAGNCMIDPRADALSSTSSTASRRKSSTVSTSSVEGHERPANARRESVISSIFGKRA